MISKEQLEQSHLITYVCSHVFENTRPILYICKEDGDWQFLCGKYHEADEIPRVVGLGHLIERDNTLLEIMELPDNWEAERNEIGGAWASKKI
jgi:hypothetical protein